MSGEDLSVAGHASGAAFAHEPMPRGVLKEAPGRWERVVRLWGRSLPVAMLGVVLTLPSLWAGFAQDDYFFLSIFEGGLEGLETSKWNTFTFSEGDPARNRLRMEYGILPWWAVETWKVDLWRPIASLTHWIDYRLFGRSAWPMHAHNLALYGLLCGLTAALYRRLMPGATAALAALLFAVDAGHGIPAGWLSNRNALLGTLFVVLSLWSHHRWRQGATPSRPGGDWRHGVLANIWLALALFSSEGAVAAGGFFFAYTVTLDPLVVNTETEASKWRVYARSVAYLLPYLAVVIVWRAIYSGLGHGVAGSWFYIDPIDEFSAFAANAPAYYAVLFLGLFGLPDSIVWTFVPPAFQAVLIVMAVLWLAVLVWVFWLVGRSDRTARFWALGVLLAIPPACSTIPADRNLMVASVGAAALVALIIVGHVTNAPWARFLGPRRRALGAVVAVLIAVHAVVSPVLLTTSAYLPALMDNAFKYSNTFPGAGDPSSRYIALNTPLDLLGASYPIMQSGLGRPGPRTWRWLYAGTGALHVERPDEHTLVLRPERGFLRRPWASIFRRPESDPIKAGYEVVLNDLTVTITDADAQGRPLEARFRFGANLDDPSLRWLSWSEGRYKPFAPPNISGHVIIPEVKLGTLLRRAPEILGGRADAEGRGSHVSGP